MKEFKKLHKLLKKAGFSLVKDGNHAIYEKDGKTICVTKNIKNANTIFNKAMGQWRQQLQS